MSDPSTKPKVVEVDWETLQKALNGEDKDKIREQINKFDRSHSAFQNRNLRTEVYANRGLIQQIHDTMRGFMKWRGTQHQMAYNLSLGLAIELGGIDKAAQAMRQKSWLEKNAPGLVLIGLFLSLYFGYLYSPDIRAAINTTLNNPSTEIGVVFIFVFILFLWWRSRRRGPQLQ